VNRHLGLHRLIADTVVAGERWLTCACGFQVAGRHEMEMRALFEQHPRRKARP
jgi:hypothetical protein